jgi:hypothetical protein
MVATCAGLVIVGDMKNTTSTKPAAPKPYVSPNGCTFSAACPCSECQASRAPNTCPDGCTCLVCFVDSLSANPPARRAA